MVRWRAFGVEELLQLVQCLSIAHAQLAQEQVMSSRLPLQVTISQLWVIWVQTVDDLLFDVNLQGRHVLNQRFRLFLVFRSHLQGVSRQAG